MDATKPQPLSFIFIVKDLFLQKITKMLMFLFDNFHIWRVSPELSFCNPCVGKR